MVFLTNLNLSGNELQNAVLQPLASAPSNPKLGQIYYNSTNLTIYIYNGTSWDELGGGAVISVNGATGVVVLTQDDVGNGSTYVRTHNDLTDALKTIVDNIQLALAEEYDSTSAYSVGEYCTNAGLLYRCNTAIAEGGEAWTSAHWTQITVTGEFAPLASPDFTGTPTAPTASSGSSSNQIATTAYVMTAVAGLGEVMVFKGVVNSNNDLPATHTKGWVYKVGTAGTYAGVVCEVGDTIVCVANGTSASDSDWYVLQANIDGAVTGPASSTDGHIPVFDGTSGKVIKDGYNVVTSITNNDTDIPTAKAVKNYLKSSVSSIGTNQTSVTISYTGSFVNAYATQGGAIIACDITLASGSVTFTVASAPSSTISCYVIYV